MNRQALSPCEDLAERYQALLEVAQAISAQRNLHQLFRDLARLLPRVVHFNYVDLSLHDPIKQLMRLYTIQANVPADLVGGHEVAVEDCPAGLVWQQQEPLLVPKLTEERRTDDPRIQDAKARYHTSAGVTTLLRHVVQP